MSDDMRQRFEAWAATNELPLTRGHDDNYFYTRVSDMWKGWQAAANRQPDEPAGRSGADIALLYCIGCGTPPGTERNTPICAAFDEEGDGEGGTSHHCATCGHNSDCHEPVFPEYAIRQFCGYLTAAIPELHQIHPDRVWRAWLGFLKKAQPTAETKESKHGD